MPCVLLRSSDALAGVNITTSSFEVGSLYVKAVPFKYKKCFGGRVFDDTRRVVMPVFCLNLRLTFYLPSILIKMNPVAESPPCLFSPPSESVN